MNSYTVVEIDKVNSEVLVDFVAGDFKLRDRIAVSDLNDAAEIDTKARTAFKAFLAQKPADAVAHPQAVEDLIDVVNVMDTKGKFTQIIPEPKVEVETTTSPMIE